jgi:fucose 4-O-acetylase-like acetyltransferase
MINLNKTINPLQSQRLKFLDVAKGILILLVVLGHSAYQFNICIYWFHMPAFFIIGGVLHYQPQRHNLKNFLKRKARSILVPYLSFGVCISLIIAIYTQLNNIVEIAKSFVLLVGRLIYSGGAVFGPFGAFWFAPCYFLSVLSFAIILFYIKDKRILFSTLILLFILGKTAISLRPFILPWSIDVIPSALFFYGMGYLLKPHLIHIVSSPSLLKSLFLAFFLLSTVLVFAQYLRGYEKCNFFQYFSRLIYTRHFYVYYFNSFKIN